MTTTLERPVKAKRDDTLAGAIHRKCHCLRCRIHAAEHRRDIYAQKAAGTWQPFVDAAPALAHAEALHAQGMSYRQIARVARVNVDVINRMRGKTGDAAASQRIRPDSANRILAVQPQFHRQARDARMPNRGALRRVRALRAIGWPVYVLMEQSGLSHATFINMHCRAGVKMSTQRAIEGLYELLYDQDPAEHGIDPAIVRRGRKYAAKQGWAVPAAWADIDTDERPNRRITAGRFQSAPATRSHSEVVAETAYLASYGLTQAQVAERMGMQWNSVAVAHNRAGVDLPVQLRQENASEASTAEAA